MMAYQTKVVTKLNMSTRVLAATRMALNRGRSQTL
jgi:hypothetical protein